MIDWKAKLLKVYRTVVPPAEERKSASEFDKRMKAREDAEKYEALKRKAKANRITWTGNAATYKDKVAKSIGDD